MCVNFKLKSPSRDFFNLNLKLQHFRLPADKSVKIIFTSTTASGIANTITTRKASFRRESAAGPWQICRRYRPGAAAAAAAAICSPSSSSTSRQRPPCELPAPTGPVSAAAMTYTTSCSPAPRRQGSEGGVGSRRSATGSRTDEGCRRRVGVDVGEQRAVVRERGRLRRRAGRELCGEGEKGSEKQIGSNAARHKYPRSPTLQQPQSPPLTCSAATVCADVLRPVAGCTRR